MKQNTFNVLKLKPGRSIVSVIAAAFLILLVIGVPVLAQDATAAVSTLPNIVLVHGAWADASSWSAVIEKLQADGYNVSAPQLALASLDDDVARVREVLNLQTGPTLLVAHSFGGAVITDLGKDAPNVVGLVYESAFAPDKGESMKAIITGAPQQPSAAALRPDAAGYMWLDPAGFLQFFAPDVDPTAAKVMAVTQKPIAAGEFLSDAVYGDPAWKFFPTWYLVTEDDQMIPAPAQQFFAQRMGATVQSIKASHVAMVSQPDAVTSFIETAAQAVAK